MSKRKHGDKKRGLATSEAASQLATLRWSKSTPEERLEWGQKLVNARRKREQERIDAAVADALAEERERRGAR